MKRIIVLGDVILDRYIFGEVNRLNPESPVPLVDVTKQEYRLGGAANVAHNIKSLGGNPYLIGVIGQDNDGIILKNILKEKEIDHELVLDTKPTIVKTRVIADGNQMIRFDKEIISKVHKDTLECLCNVIQIKLEDIVLISDYNKGVITEYVSDRLKNMHCRILIDPKPENESIYPKAYLIKPNQKEYAQMKIEDGKYQNVLVTRGKDGMMLYNNNIVHEILAIEKDVYDVCGAGDTVIATIANYLNKDYSLLDSVKMGNKAASIVVNKIGTSYVTKEELENE